MELSFVHDRKFIDFVSYSMVNKLASVLLQVESLEQLENEGLTGRLDHLCVEFCDSGAQ